MKNKAKDRSKYTFNKEKLNKGKLVNAVLKYYVTKNTHKTYLDLKKEFPDKIQGRNGVFTTKANAEALFRKENRKRKRFYIKEMEFISLKDEIIATSNQWNFENILIFIEHARNLGLDIFIYNENLDYRQADKILWIGNNETDIKEALLYYERENPNTFISIIKNNNFHNNRRNHIKELIKTDRNNFPKLNQLL